MSRPLGFEQQGFLFTNTEWACGAYSFGHLLNLLGLSNSIDKNKKILKTEGGVLDLPPLEILKGLFNKYKNVGGTTHPNIIKQIRKIGSEIIIEESYEKEAKALLDRNLNKLIPFIVNVDDSDHWMVVAGKFKNKYIVIDSADENTIDFYTWDELSDRWACWCEKCYDKYEDESSGEKYCKKCSGDGWCTNCGGDGEVDGIQCRSCKGSGECIKCKGDGWMDYCDNCDGTADIYYGIGLSLPRDSEIGTKAGLKHIEDFIEYLRDDVELQENWGFYLEDLTEIFELNQKVSHMMSVTDFFDEYSEHIVEMVELWICDSEYYIQDELDNYRFVAEFYDFKFPKSDIKEVLINFTVMFALSMADYKWDTDCAE